MKSNNIPLIDSIQQHGLYSQDYEHDSCGVGLVANIDGKPSHSILSRGIEVLRKLGHRGASGADPDTGDGAGPGSLPVNTSQITLGSAPCKLS